MTRTPLRRQSTKQRRKQKAWKEIVEERMEVTQGQCEFPKCYSRAVDGHHVQPRGSGGENTYENCAVYCRAHHDEIHAHEMLARLAGLLK